VKLRALAIALACVSCATPPMPIHVPDGTIYEGTSGPIQYRGHAIRDLTVPARPREAFGEACRFGIYLPSAPSSPFLGSAVIANVANLPTLGVAWGDGGIIRALAAARASAHGAEIYDVRLDVHSIQVLGIFHHDCVEVHAAVLPPRATAALR
jgi:hypothetical protein